MAGNKYKDEMSIYESSEFWDEHDFGEFDDIQETGDLQFMLRKKKYVGIDTKLYSMITAKAKALDTTEDVLINQWLSEKITV